MNEMQIFNGYMECLHLLLDKNRERELGKDIGEDEWEERFAEQLQIA